MINKFKLLRENNRTLPLFIKWLGFNTAFIEIEHAKRLQGDTSYNFAKLFALSVDWIIAHSNKPLRLSINFGLILSFIALVAGIVFSFRYVYADADIPLGWTSLIVSLFFISGLLFANLGLIGLYIGKMFDEIKRRPLYIVKETVGLEIEGCPRFDKGKNQNHENSIQQTLPHR